jgi:hypothetical protein
VDNRIRRYGRIAGVAIFRVVNDGAELDSILTLAARLAHVSSIRQTSKKVNRQFQTISQASEIVRFLAIREDDKPNRPAENGCPQHQTDDSDD